MPDSSTIMQTAVRVATVLAVACGLGGVLLAPFGQAGAQGPLRATAQPTPPPPALTSHHATYDMRLATSRPASGIVGAGGTMTYTFTVGCDGWTVETRTDLTMMQAQGGPLETTWDFVAWEAMGETTGEATGEATDTQSYRFRVRNTRNGTAVEAYEGTATLDADGGQARFTLSGGDGTGGETIDLPPGTLLPTRHTQELVRRARAGGRFLAAPVFDGSGIHGAFLVTAAIGREVSPDTLQAHIRERDEDLAAANLLTGPAWPMTLAFFSPDTAGPGADDAVPDFEVSLRYHANGVAENLFQDFGDFSLRGALRSLDALPPPQC